MAVHNVMPFASLAPPVSTVTGGPFAVVIRCFCSLRRSLSPVPASSDSRTSRPRNGSSFQPSAVSVSCPLLRHWDVAASCSRRSDRVLSGFLSPRGLPGVLSTADGISLCTPRSWGTSRFFSTVNKTSRESGMSPPQTSTWLEVERVRPQVPSAFDGTYQWPEAAPNPLDIKRENFHAFMHGKSERFSRELKIFLYGWGCVILMGSLVAGTIWVMTPDDFEWVEEERMRMEQAKRKKASAELALSGRTPSSDTSMSESNHES